MALKTFYVCSECGYKISKYMGKCPNCGAWNSFCEDVEDTSPKSAAKKNQSPGGYSGMRSEAKLLSDISEENTERRGSGYGEIDRVLGGGIVNGSVVLLSGEPGIGKSTLLMQICGYLSSKGSKVLYVSGEESPSQLKMRAKRLDIKAGELYIQTETEIQSILDEAEKINPDFIIADSIQTVSSEDSSSMPGSITQVRECTGRFISYAKGKNVTVILVGHVNKDGGIAGPKVLEHMVDTVLHFEGDRDGTYRIVRAEKNRFGATNEIGVFEMTGKGLVEVASPSEALLAGRPKDVSGNCAVCVMEGTRPLIAEIQALCAPTVYPSPKRTSNGIEFNRIYMLLAVLEKRLGLKFSVLDCYLNVIGGIRLEDTGADLPTALALISCMRDKPIDDGTIAVGEIGLSGEIRAVSNIEQRVKEASRLGFSRIILPERNMGDGKLKDVSGIELCPVKSVYDALLKIQ